MKNREATMKHDEKERTKNENDEKERKKR